MTSEATRVIQDKYGDGNVDIDHTVDTLQEKVMINDRSYLFAMGFA